MKKRIRAICPYDCPTSCGFFCEVENDKMAGVTVDPEHPANKGLICGKMRNYERAVNREDRILTPLKRTGAKGSGEFTPVSWEDALSLIAEKWKETLREDGPDAFAYLYYSGVMSQIQRFAPEALMNKIGARPMIATLCSTPKGSGFASVLGQTGALDPRELADSDLYVIWSCNMPATRLQTMPVIQKAGKEGKKVVQVDVYGEPNAPFCDDTYLIRPGTDGALALALMNELSRTGKEDEAFLREQAIGYEKFKDSLKRYTPEWAAGITGLSAERIRKLAEVYGSRKAPAILLGSGFSRYGNGGMNARLITILSLWTGAWQYKGGGLCGTNPTGSTYVGKNIAARPDFRTHTGPSFNINLAGQELARTETAADGTPPAKCLYVWGCNPANAVSDSGAVLRGLSRENLFTVVHERTMTDTARYADIILPATYSVEQSDIYTSYGYCTLGCAYRAVKAPGEAKSNWDTTCLLAGAMGYDDPFFRKTEEEMVQEYIDSASSEVKEQGENALQVLREGGVISLPFADHTRWKTPSGKIMLVNETMADPVPGYRPSYGARELESQEIGVSEAEKAIIGKAETCKTVSDNSGACNTVSGKSDAGNAVSGMATGSGTCHGLLQLVSVPSSHTLNTAFSEREDLLARRGEPVLALNTQDADAREIKTGDRVLCRNDLGSVEFVAKVSEWTAQGTAAAIGVYGSETALGDTWVNFLHHSRLSDLGEATAMNDNTVEVVRKPLG